MKTGYSILLGEFIDAEVLEHRDCEPFQIVCPVCSEPLFKVSRSEESKSSEYLSHYRKSEAYDPNCELRSERSASRERKKHNSQSRNQKLEYFLSVFRAALANDPVTSYSKGLESTQKFFEKSKALKIFRSWHLDSARRSGCLADYEQFKEFADFYINETGGLGGMPVTGFSISTQIRIASDLAKHLLTEKGQPNYNALFNHAVVVLIYRCMNPDPSESAESVEVMSNVASYLSGLIRRGKKEGMELLSEMEQRPLSPPYVFEPSNYSRKVAAEVAHEMVGALVRLPYFSLLKQSGHAEVPRAAQQGAPADVIVPSGHR